MVCSLNRRGDGAFSIDISGSAILSFQPTKLLETKHLDKSTFHLHDGSFRDLGPNAVCLGLFMWRLLIVMMLPRGYLWRLGPVASDQEKTRAKDLDTLRPSLGRPQCDGRFRKPPDAQACLNTKKLVSLLALFPRHGSFLLHSEPWRAGGVGWWGAGSPPQHPCS